MTKLRAPLSVEQALARIAGQLPAGVDTMAEVAGRSVSLVRKWGDPDRDEQIPLDCAIALDLAYQAAGGEGCPLHQAYTAKLEISAAARFADRFELLRRATDVIKEGGEAHAALTRACLPDATRADEDHALRELAEAFEAIKPTLAALGAAPGNERAPP